MGKMKFCGSKEHCFDWALLVLRIALGVVFIVHGYGKLFGGSPGMEAFTGLVAKIGFPLPAFFAYVAACAEFFGGIAILLGIFTGISTILVGFNMLVALVALKKFQFPASDLEFSLLCMAIAVHLMGPGKYSLAAKMGMKGMSGCCGSEKHGGGCCAQEEKK